MDILTMYAESQPEKPAIIDDAGDGPVVTYAELEERACRLANALRDLGVGAKDKVTVVGYNRPEHLIAGNATRKIGAVNVPMNYRLKPPEISYQLNDSDSKVIIAGPEHVEAVSSILDGCPTVEHAIAFGTSEVPAGWKTMEEVISSGSAEPPETEGEAMGGATMTYTAGTTGNPKGAYRERMDSSATAGWLSSFDLQSGDVHLVAGPLYHSAPGAFALITGMLGGTNVIMRRFDPERALQLIEEHKVQTTFMAPTLLQRLAGLPEDVRKRYDLSSMRVIIVAAAPCPFELKRRIIEMFGEVLYEFYGSSEAGINTVMRPEEQLRKPGSCGKVAPGNEIVILDEEGNECPPGVPGEVYIKNPAIITEYYKKPEETKSSWRGDFFTVGDVGYFDEDGYLYIVDRKRDMVISGGANIYCAEIENVIHSHPKVWDVAVFGVPDEEWGERVHAVVQPRPGERLSEQEIAGYVSENLADYKKPRSVEFREELPRDEAGKIRKRDLREPYWEGRQRRV